MAKAKETEPSYIDAWGKWWHDPWRRLMVQVVKLSEADAERARLVLGGDATPAEPEPDPSGDPQPGASPPPRPPFRRTHMPPPPGATP